MSACGAFALGILLALPGAARGSLITGNYQINYDENVEKLGAGVTETRKFKHTLELKYRGFLSPVVENEITFKFEQEINSNAPDVTRFLPTLDLGLRAKFWEAKSGARRTHENSDDPGTSPTVADTYYVEFFYHPPRSIPDLKAKYTLDTSVQAGASDTEKTGVTVSSVFSPTRWLDMKGEYTRNENDDKFARDSDTEEEKATGSVALKHLLSKKVRVDLQYLVEATSGATLLDAGGKTNEKDDMKQTAKSLLSYRPFRDTDVAGSYDFDMKQNRVTGEDTVTGTSRVTVSQKIMTPINVKGEFNRVVTETKHTVDDYTKTEDTVTADLTAKFSKRLDFTFRRQDKHTVEDHVDVSKSQTFGTLVNTATWSAELASFWLASVSYDATDTFAWNAAAGREEKTTVDEKYSLKSTVDFKDINLMIEPTYDIILKDDFVTSRETAIRDFRFKFVYFFLKTRTLDGKVDHTYGRKTDTGAANIQRTDSTTANVTLTDPLPGWKFGFDVTRQATDTSEDDQAPDINTSFGFKADYKYEWLSLGTSYKYDKKLPTDLKDNGETFDLKAGWTSPRWEWSMTYTFSKTFSEELREKYSIAMTFKYNL